MTISTENSAPAADAGPDQQVETGALSNSMAAARSIPMARRSRSHGRCSRVPAGSPAAISDPSVVESNAGRRRRRGVRRAVDRWRWCAPQRGRHDDRDRTRARRLGDLRSSMRLRDARSRDGRGLQRARREPGSCSATTWPHVFRCPQVIASSPQPPIGRLARPRLRRVDHRPARCQWRGGPARHPGVDQCRRSR